jgi:hypothetical protein
MEGWCFSFPGTPFFCTDKIDFLDETDIVENSIKTLIKLPPHPLPNHHFTCAFTSIGEITKKILLWYFSIGIISVQ